MSTTETQLPNYRIYDRTGGGVRQDIYAASLEEAIEAGRDWIEDGDWSERGNPPGTVIELPCCVREIVRWPKDPLPGQYEDEDGDIFDTSDLNGALLCYASERGQINDHETDHGQSWDCTGTYTER